MNTVVGATADRCCTVKVVPGQNILVPAAKVMNNAIRNGFVLDRAKSPYQLSQHGISPPYTDAFVDEVRNTMQTCRVLYVSLPNFALQPLLDLLIHSQTVIRHFLSLR